MEKDNLKDVEGSYLVLDWSDVQKALSEESLEKLKQIVFAVRGYREVKNGKDPLEGIFVEKSYPFYEDTLQKAKMYFKQKNRKEFTMISLGGQNMSVTEDINPKRVNRGVCIKVTGKEEFIDATYLRHIIEGGSAVLNMNEYHISSHPIKGDQIMLQVRERHNGFTHFFQTTRTSLNTMLKEVM